MRAVTSIKPPPSEATTYRLIIHKIRPILNLNGIDGMAWPMRAKRSALVTPVSTGFACCRILGTEPQSP